jgi:hypothetical protein
MTGKKPGKLFMLNPVLMPHVSCNLTTGNSFFPCYSAIKVLIIFGVDAKVIENYAYV